MRRYATVELSLEHVTTICDRFEVTVNDVVLAAITHSFRTMLIRRGEQVPAQFPAYAGPVSVRSHDAADKTGNRVSVMLPHLPVEKADPISQLRSGIAILSDADHLAFGIIGDYHAAPDVDELASGIKKTVARLAAVSAGHWRSTPVGTLALVLGG